MENNCYVYEWIRLDTNEPFYVGKGSGNRCYKLTREKNNHFNNIVKSIPVAVNILHDNLDEQTAFGLEIYYIWLYRDIIGYESMCNINDGGEGCALCGENSYWYGKKRPEMSGENNPMNGKKRPEHSERMSGKNHPMYGKDWREGKTEEELLEHDRKISEAMKGENNPMYGVHRYGKNSPHVKSVIAIINDKIFGAFDYAKQGAELFGCNYSNIIQCCKGKIKSCGKYNSQKIIWKYIEIIEL